MGTENSPRRTLHSKPSISVIIPCYNSADTIKNTIDALLEQTYPAKEIIVVNDGSTDSSPSIVSSYGYPVILVNQRNQGAASARYTGVTHATSDIVAFCDAGDISTTDRLKLFSTAFLEYPEAVAAYALTYIESQNKISKSNTGGLKTTRTVDLVKDPLGILLSQSWPMAIAMNIAIRKEIALDSANIPLWYKAGNDYALQVNTARFGPFAFINRVTLKYKETIGGLSHTHGLNKQNAYALISAHETLSNLETPNLKHYNELFHTRASEECGKLFIDLCIQGQSELLERIDQTCRMRCSRFDRAQKGWWEIQKMRESKVITTSQALYLIMKLLRFSAR